MFLSSVGEVCEVGVLRIARVCNFFRPSVSEVGIQKRVRTMSALLKNRMMQPDKVLRCSYNVLRA